MDKNAPYEFGPDDETEELDPREIYVPPPQPTEDFPEWALYPDYIDSSFPPEE